MSGGRLFQSDKPTEENCAPLLPTCEGAGPHTGHAVPNSQCLWESLRLVYYYIVLARCSVYNLCFLQNSVTKANNCSRLYASVTTLCLLTCQCFLQILSPQSTNLLIQLSDIICSLQSVIFHCFLQILSSQFLHKV